MALDLILKEVDSGLPAALNEIWPIVEKARAEMGISQTTTEMTLGNLQFAGETPITYVQQCAAQAEQIANALHSSYWNLKKQKLKVQQLREKGDEMSTLKADQIESDMRNSEHYIRTGYNNLVHYQETAALIRKKFNLPDDISPQQLSENSKREHIRKAMRQALRDVENSGAISKGVSEHLEQYGIHPMTAKVQCLQYRDLVHQMIQNNEAPTMEHLLDWLDQMEIVHAGAPDDMLRLMRLKDFEPEN